MKKKRYALVSVFDKKKLKLICKKFKKFNIRHNFNRFNC